jgi:hypothetical protein
LEQYPIRNKLEGRAESKRFLLDTLCCPEFATQEL